MLDGACLFGGGRERRIQSLHESDQAGLPPFSIIVIGALALSAPSRARAGFAQQFADAIKAAKKLSPKPADSCVKSEFDPAAKPVHHRNPLDLAAQLGRTQGGWQLQAATAQGGDAVGYNLRLVVLFFCFSPFGVKTPRNRAS
jgi:hypothetical protein